LIQGDFGYIGTLPSKHKLFAKDVLLGLRLYLLLWE